MHGRQNQIIVSLTLLLAGVSFGRGGGHAPVGIRAAAPAPAPRPAPTHNSTPSRTHPDYSKYSDHHDYRRDRFRRRGIAILTPGYSYIGDGTDSGTVTSSSGTGTPTPPAASNVPVGESSVDSRARPDRTQRNRVGGTAGPGAKGRMARVDPALILAVTDVDAARMSLRALVRNRPDYQAAAAEKKAAQDEAASMHESNAEIEDILPFAQRALAASRRMSQIEREAEFDDPKVAAARAKLDSALARLNDLRPVQ